MATFEEAAMSGEEFMRRTKPNGEAKPGPALVTAKAFVSGFKPPQYEIDSLLRRGCIYSVTALTGHGKTAVCLCLGVHMALGRNLHGHSVEQGTSVYFAAENPDDTKMRVVLMADRLNLDLGTLPMHFVEGGFNIEDWTDHIRGQAEAIGDARLSRSIPAQPSRLPAASQKKTTTCRRFGSRWRCAASLNCPATPWCWSRHTR
jgi:AAA domain